MKRSTQVLTTLAIAIATLALGASQASGAIIDYQFTDPLDLNPTTETDGTGSIMTLNSSGANKNKDNVLFDDGADVVRGARWALSTVTTTDGQPDDGTSYLQFTVNAPGGEFFQGSTAQIAFDGFQQRRDANFHFYGSTDGGTTFTLLETRDDEDDATSVSASTLGDSASYLFRIYGTKTGQDSESGFNSITFTSDTAVPEPATMSLLALGGLGVLIRRRNG